MVQYVYLVMDLRGEIFRATLDLEYAERYVRENKSTIYLWIDKERLY